MKLLLSISLFILFSIQVSNSAFGLVWVNSVNLTNPPATECTPTVMTVAGDLSANHQFNMSSFAISGSNITISVDYTSGIGIQVITPFIQNVDLGLVPSGTYTVLTQGLLNGAVQSSYSSTLIVTSCCGADADFSYPIGICLGETIQLTNSSTGASSQEWFENGTSVSTNLDYSITPTTTGNVVFKLVASNGTCEDSVEYTVNVLDLPSITALTPNQTTLCEGEQLIITSTSNNGANYFWTDNGTFAGLSSTLTTNPVNSGPHVYQLQISNGYCADSLETTVTVNATPTIDNFSSSASTICLGESFDLTSSSTGASSIIWYENGTQLTMGSNLTMTPTSEGAYTYKLVVGNGLCADSMETMVTVNPLPTIDDFNPSHTTLCLGDTVDFTSASNNASSFEWLENGNSVGNMNDYSSTPAPEGVYTYQLVVGLNGCFDSTSHNVTVVELPMVDLGLDTNDCFGPILLDAGAGSGAGYTYVWQDQSSNQTLTPTTTGIYSVTVTDGNGCSNYDEMSFESCASLSEIDGKKIVLYPNPVESSARIDLNGFQGNILINIRDINGKLVQDQALYTSGVIEINFNDLNSGIYFVKLITSNADTMLKVIKE